MRIGPNPRLRPRYFAAMAAAALATAFGALSGHAQSANPTPGAEDLRSGFHFSIGVGGGSVSASCPGCDVDFFQDRINGVSGVLQLGGFVTSRLAIAAEFMGWVRNDDPIYRRIAGLGVSVMGYPSETNGFFVKGSFGGLRAIGEDDFLLVQTDAYMSTTGIGYDVPVGEQVSVTAYANYVRTFGAGTWVNGFSSDIVVTPDAFQFGLALTVH